MLTLRIPDDIYENVQRAAAAAEQATLIVDDDIEVVKQRLRVAQYEGLGRERRILTFGNLGIVSSLPSSPSDKPNGLLKLALSNRGRRVGMST